MAYDSAVQLAVFSFSHRMLALPPDPVAGLTAVSITADEGTGALAGPLLRRVAQDLESYPPASAARLSTVVMDLLTTAIAERAGQHGPMPAESRQRTLLFRIHAFIEQHLADTGLAPGNVAAAHYISVRHLHRLFETQDTTLAGWIRHRRLERCRKDLADPALRALPVSAVAARWGLADPAVFSRLFRRTYGMAPSEYRRSCLPPPSGPSWASSPAVPGGAEARHACP